MVEPVVSCCITCMNRGAQLKQTLEHNLSTVAGFGGLVELCLVNFIKDEEGERIDTWVRSLGSRPHFKYFVTRELSVWHASVAKNTAHMQGDGDVLLNLDCDNYLSADSLSVLVDKEKAGFPALLFSGFTGGFREEFTRHKKILGRIKGAVRFFVSSLDGLRSGLRMKWRPVLLRSKRKEGGGDFNGTYGHIGISRELFNRIGGYDESLPPMGGQDKDLLWRAYNYVGVVFEHVPQPQSLLPILNSKVDSMKNTDITERSWTGLQDQATRKSLQSIRVRALQVNTSSQNLGVPVERVF